jgi:hypothetical protein
MDGFLNAFVLYTSVAAPVLFAAWAWRSWFKTGTSSLSPWRRAATVISLSLLSCDMCVGAFALAFIYLRPSSDPGLPQPTITALQIGAPLAAVALLCSCFAKSWTRLALILSGVGLLWFFFLIALSP